jgi:NAD(P)H-hydrate epimerase
VLPIVTPQEMAAIDAAATVPVETLVERAGAAVARSAQRMLGGTYGRTVNVVAGPGNNGADGRAAAKRLAARGMKVRLFEAAAAPDVLPSADLVIDAAYGTGFHGEYHAPDNGGARVLAVDIPSGVDGLTGRAGAGVQAADRTVTFAALKPGLVFPPGSVLTGELEVADIGLAVDRAQAFLVQRDDVASWWRPRPVTANKWSRAVRVVGGSAGMTGAARLAASAAQRAGAGMVHLTMPGDDGDGPVEAVGRPAPAFDWDELVLSDLGRFHALVIGPGLGREEYTVPAVRRVVAAAEVPTVIDGDGIFAMAWDAEAAPAVLRRRRGPTVLTPHDGEYALLMGGRPGPDRIEAARRLAEAADCVALLKGPSTVVAHPNGRALVVTTGDARLATAGTGDVLAGIIGALLSSGMGPWQAAAAGAWIHGQAAALGPQAGLVAGDLPALVPAVVESFE